ncbi:hypothetical protein K469DRAFT_586157 [Zopfia rhizophila CBS 207.26]|uniref:Uncharacterized protein n=1 Tax=Zopfia rhizophila CBS 207.26 TaxID=1314779 RepID=A0A6A6DSM4_9PEZI|nr:hypothetical protein K469DRAFT_586157 [Zopfia rhizophila CBS 207.26]
MRTVEWVFGELDVIGEHMWDISLDNSAFNSLKTKISKLSAQIAVHHALENTVTQLQEFGTLTDSQNRVGKFLEALYGDSDCPTSTDESRWRKLRSLDCETFLLIATSYTPIGITKMSRTEFDYLIENAPKYLHTKPPPPRWMFRREFQIALAAKAELAGMGEFKRRVY